MGWHLFSLLRGSDGADLPNRPRIHDIRRRTEVQAFPAWNPPTGTLGGIVAEARDRAQALRQREDELAGRAAQAPEAPAFAAALRTGMVGVIAEVKRRSPSKGWIKAGLSAVDQALAYE